MTDIERQNAIDAAKLAMDLHPNAFYDGPDDPLIAAALKFQAELDAAIADAGGLEAWRARQGG